VLPAPTSFHTSAIIEKSAFQTEIIDDICPCFATLQRAL
jgi:hypothetical protein